MKCLQVFLIRFQQVNCFFFKLMFSLSLFSLLLKFGFVIQSACANLAVKTFAAELINYVLVICLS